MSVITDTDWNLVVDRIRQRRCVAFLGSAASLEFNNEAGLPSAGQLSHELAIACDYPGADPYDFLRVAQYFEGANDRYALRTYLQSRLDPRDPVNDVPLRQIQPTMVHRLIASLPFEYVLTTNFDTLMEDAFRSAGKTPHMDYYQCFGVPRALPVASVNKPIVYKLHGTIEDWETLIATEHDVVEFMSCVFLQRPPLPDVARGLFRTHSFLFIGYGLRDWNVRVLLQAIRNGERGVASGLKSYAVQRRPNDAGPGREWDQTVEFWDRQANMICANMDAPQFVTELRTRCQLKGLLP